MGGCKVCIKKNRTDWLNTLLLSKFFGSCGVHHDLRKNEKNVFCIDCGIRLCRHCMTAHCLHTKLQICKYVYHDVVRLQEIQKHLDCSKIQTYKINGEKAVHLNPRPLAKDAKPSTKVKFGASCEACGRYLQDMPNRYCSIACKASIVSVKPEDQSHKFIAVTIPQFGDFFSLKGNCNSETNMSEMESSISLAESSGEMTAWVCSALKPRKLLHKMKLPEFCASANLLCFSDLGQSLEKHDKDSTFMAYGAKNFTNYGTDRLAGVDSFKNYSLNENLPVNSFRRYSHDSVNHKDQFINYASDGNVVDQSFNSYAGGATSGAGEFKKYADSVNVPNLRFNSYSDDSNGRAQSFTSYTENGNAGDQSFTSYSKNGNGAPNEFTGYGTSSNVVGSGFTGYGETGNGAHDKFNNYGKDMNNPVNRFKSYGDGGNAAVETFTSYREKANVGEDSFQSYAKNSNGEKINFANYGKSFNVGFDKFTGYGKGAEGQSIGFKIYGVNNSFSDYAKKERISFKSYTKASSGKGTTMAASGSLVKRWVEPGKFFRESMLKKGVVMPMPDIQDKMPKRSFLPRTISSKLPFATSKIAELKQIFHADDNSTMEKIILDALQECERAPSAGETKRCVGSAEDMIDFATTVLGRNVVVRSTENVNGAKHNVMIGSVKGINGGKVTQSVSCHQSLFPYLLYYCHSVPKVRVYEADLLDPLSKAKINHGVAICHLDTSAWSPTHGSFMALGSGPGQIEVCHWIFQNDMTWAIAD